MRKLVLRNGKIYVERGRFAQALYAEDGVIQAVGTEEEVLTQRENGMVPGMDWMVQRSLTWRAAR